MAVLGTLGRAQLLCTGVKIKFETYVDFIHRFLNREQKYQFGSSGCPSDGLSLRFVLNF